MILYGASMSPFVRKVLVFADEKGIALELTMAHARSTDPGFLEASPFRKIPALRDDDFVLADSSAIVAYLDALHPEPNLIPTEPRARAKTVWFEEFADSILTGTGVKIVFNRLVAPMLGMTGDAAAADRAEAEELPPILDYLEGVIPESGFLVEDRFTLADIAVASPLASLPLADWRGDAARHPKLTAWTEAIHARPAFARWMAQDRVFLQARGAA